MSNKTEAAALEWEVLPLAETLNVDDRDDHTQIVLKRRALRADVQHLSPSVEIGNFGKQGRRFPVKTIAELGASFFHGGVDLSGELNRERLCWVRVGAVRIPVRCTIRYVDAEVAGVEFLDPTSRTRLALRTHFFFELMTAGLHSKKTPHGTEPGAPYTLSYGDGTNHGLELSVGQGRLENFKISLGSIGAEVIWRSGEVLHVLLRTGEDVPPAFIRRQLVGFLRNLRGLNPRVRQAVETVSTHAKIVCEQA